MNVSNTLGTKVNVRADSLFNVDVKLLPSQEVDLRLGSEGGLSEGGHQEKLPPSATSGSLQHRLDVKTFSPTRPPLLFHTSHTAMKLSLSPQQTLTQTLGLGQVGFLAEALPRVGPGGCESLAAYHCGCVR